MTVVLEHMFSPSEMEEEATLREDLQDDIKTECLKMGPVEKVRAICICYPTMVSNAATACQQSHLWTVTVWCSVVRYLRVVASFL